MPRYAAKLVFQFRKTATNGKESRRRVCEERIIHFQAPNDDDALRMAISYGRDNEFHDTEMRRDIWFEFIGVAEIDSFDTDYGKDPVEVWWEFRERLLPMERRTRLIPPKDRLRLFQDINSPNRKIKL